MKSCGCEAFAHPAAAEELRVVARNTVETVSRVFIPGRQVERGNRRRQMRLPLGHLLDSNRLRRDSATRVVVLCRDWLCGVFPDVGHNSTETLCTVLPPGQVSSRGAKHKSVFFSLTNSGISSRRDFVLFIFFMPNSTELSRSSTNTCEALHLRVSGAAGSRTHNLPSD